MTSITIDWPNIKVISFDLDDTLWPNAGVIQNANQAMLNKLHELVPKTEHLLPVSRLQQWHKQFFMTVTGIDHDLNQKRLQAIANYLRSIDTSDPHNVITEQVFNAFYQARQQVELYADVLPTLERLSKRFRLVSLTNGNADMNQINGQQFFESHHTAAQFGIAKPDPDIYRQLLTAIKCPTHQIVHIGDSLTMDVEAAQKAGIASVWLDRKSNSQVNELEKNRTKETQTAANLEPKKSVVKIQPQLTVNNLIQLADMTAAIKAPTE
jgi:FMN hydrolase / 5-amino-6-(5-phospho-D-ribitylamino)uracil phosphatase